MDKEELLNLAKEDVKGGMGINAAAKKHGVSKTTLMRRLKDEPAGSGGSSVDLNDITETVIDGLEDPFDDNENLLSQDVDSSSLPLKTMVQVHENEDEKEPLTIAEAVRQATNEINDSISSSVLEMVASPAVAVPSCESCPELLLLTAENMSLKETSEQVPVLEEKLKILESASSSVEMLQQRIEVLDNEKGRLEDEIASLNNKLSSAPNCSGCSIITELENEKYILKKQVNDLSNEKTTLENEVSKKAELIKTTQDSLDEKLTEIITIKTERDTFEKQWLGVSAESVNLGKHLAGTKHALEDMQHEKLKEFQRANENQGLLTTAGIEMQALIGNLDDERNRLNEEFEKRIKGISKGSVSAFFKVAGVFTLIGIVIAAVVVYYLKTKFHIL